MPAHNRFLLQRAADYEVKPGVADLDVLGDRRGPAFVTRLSDCIHDRAWAYDSPACSTGDILFGTVGRIL